MKSMSLLTTSLEKSVFLALLGSPRFSRVLTVLNARLSSSNIIKFISGVKLHNLVHIGAKVSLQ